MPDRATTLTHALAATGITVGGVATGLHYEVLLAGFAGALASLSYLPLMGTWSRVWTLFTSSLAAGYTAPFLAAIPAKMIGDGDISLAALTFTGLLMGLGSQAMIPVAIQKLRARMEGIK